MRLLFDENLSRRLLRRIEDLFPGSAHVAELGLAQTADAVIWEYAKTLGFCILSADSDFYDRAIALGAPPKVIWLKGCDYPNDVAEELMRTQAIRIAAFMDDSEAAILVLPKPTGRG